MNSYLDLVSKYGKMHKKKSRLTVICIAISVMLVTAVFGLADMSIKAQITDYIRKNGNFHAIITDITDDSARRIGGRRDVNMASWLGMAEDTVYRGKELVIQSGTQEFAAQMNLIVTEGSYPSEENEALLDGQALTQFDISIGDFVEVPFADGETRRYRITGAYGEFSGLLGSDSHGLFLSPEGMRALPHDLYKEYLYIQFKDGVNIRRALSEIREQYGLSTEQISVNTRLLGLMGQSDDSTILEIYLTAFLLFFLVAIAGTFMIAGSFHMSILERTRFFGLLRCLGATKKQIRRYVRLEGLYYCLKGIPAGLLAGCFMLWISIFSLNALNIPDIPPMEMFQISLPGVWAGALVGFLVVMTASGSPAKYAAKVSPQAAVTGNFDDFSHQKIKKASNTEIFHVDTAMGIRHACSSKKSMVLTAGSFAVSIILFLGFSVLITFMNHALKPLQPYSPDLSVKGTEDYQLVSRTVMEDLKQLPYFKNVYGRMFSYQIPAECGQEPGTVMLISYDAPQFQWAQDILLSGKMEDVMNGGGVLVEHSVSKEMNWKTGDKITLHIGGMPKEVRIAGILSDIPFDAENGGWEVVCSEDTFTELTGISDYTIIDMQTAAGLSLDVDLAGQVRKMIPDNLLLLDSRLRNKQTRTGFLAMAVFVYGFLIVIGLVALINIINTVNASVSSRTGSYGVMRAVGMSGRQLKKVVRAEAAVYAVTGSIAGGILGLLLHRFLFQLIITSNWGDAWQPPLAVLAVAVTASVLTTFLAVIPPMAKIDRMSIVSVVNAE